MNFSFTDEQEQFRSVVQRFLNEKSPTTEVRKLMATDSGYDPEVWRQLSDDLGLPAINIPEVYGGAGFGPVELGIVMEELGRSLLCAPYFSSCVLASNAILNTGNETQKQELLPGLASGQSLASLAVTEPNGRWDVDGIECTATSADGSHRLSGTKSFVLDGCTAGMLVVVAREAGSISETGLSFFLLDANTEGVTRRALRGMDPTRKLAEIQFDGAMATPLGETGNGYQALTRTLDHAAIALANEMVGGAQALLNAAVEYAKMRMQFGRAIGSFQAIKDKCGDMLIDVELTKSAA